MAKPLAQGDLVGRAGGIAQPPAREHLGVRRQVMRIYPRGAEDMEFLRFLPQAPGAAGNQRKQSEIQQPQFSLQNRVDPFCSGTSLRGTTPESVSRTVTVFSFGLAEQMGRELAVVRGDALRRSVSLQPGKPYMSMLLYPEFAEPHRRGELLVAA